MNTEEIDWAQLRQSEAAISSRAVVRAGLGKGSRVTRYINRKRLAGTVKHCGAHHDHDGASVIQILWDGAKEIATYGFGYEPELYTFGD